MSNATTVDGIAWMKAVSSDQMRVGRFAIVGVSLYTDGNRGVPLDVGLNEVELCLTCELVRIGTGVIVDGGGKRILEWCQA